MSFGVGISGLNPPPTHQGVYGGIGFEWGDGSASGGTIICNPEFILPPPPHPVLGCTAFGSHTYSTVATGIQVTVGGLCTSAPFNVGPKTTVVSSVNPSKLGHAIVFTASVAGNFATGTVQFMDGTTNLGTPVTLSGGGIAQFMTSTLTRGRHAITAVYSGDANNPPNESVVLIQLVGKVRLRGG